MKLDYLKDKKESISIVLLGVSVFLAVCILLMVTGFFVTSARAEKLVKDTIAQSKPDPNDTEKYFAKSREVADELKKKNLFAPPPPKQQPIKQVLGIMGDEALINGTWYRVGAKVGDARIVAIEPTQIKFKWEGKEIALAPIDAASSPGKGMPARAKAGPGAPTRAGGAEMVQVGPERGPMPGRGEEGFGGMRERFENMSAEEREQFRAERRERFGGRRGPGGEGGRGGERGRGGRGR